MLDIFNTLVQLVATFLTLLIEIGSLAVRHALLLAWIAWWLWGVNWTKAWRVLAQGGWVVLVLLSLIAALAWASLAPSSYDLFGLITVGNFWWQLGAVTLMVLSALFCGWVQGVFGWQPAEIELEPPVHAHADHGHH